MPRYEQLATSVTGTDRGIYSSFFARAQKADKLYPLHIGDTWLDPAEGCRIENVTLDAEPGNHRYAPVRGIGPLLKSIAERVATRMQFETTPKDVLVLAGATGALAGAVRAIVNPGERVLLAAPYWPLIAGIVRTFNGEPVSVPVEETWLQPERAIAAFDAACDDKTVAIYLSSPNNPTGTVIPPAWLQAVTAWARDRDLWIISDEVYEDYIYSGEHNYVRPMAPERTLSAHSFSKAFGMAGYRVGYIVGPEQVIRRASDVGVHTSYGCGHPNQLAALRALDGRGDAWAAAARTQYAAMGRKAAKRLGVAAPQGSTFLFLDIAAALRGRTVDEWLGECADEGLLFAPGASFGDYPNHVRVCFTSAPPEDVQEAIEILARKLDT